MSTVNETKDDEEKNPVEQADDVIPLEDSEMAGERMSADGLGHGNAAERDANALFDQVKRRQGRDGSGLNPIELQMQEQQIALALNRPAPVDEQVGVDSRIKNVLNTRPEIGQNLKNLLDQIPPSCPPGQGNDRDPHVRIGRAVFQYAMSGNDAGRREALEMLKREALSGDNPSAIKVLRDLSTLDAALRLADAGSRLDKNPGDPVLTQNKNRALMDLASLELSGEGANARKFLDAQSQLPSEKNPAPGVMTVRDGRAGALQEQEGRAEVLAGEMKRVFASRDPLERAAALANINTIAGEGILQDNRKMERAAQFANMLDAVSNSGGSPTKAAQSVLRVHELARSGNQYAKDLLEKLNANPATAGLGATDNLQALKQMLSNPDALKAFRAGINPLETQARNFQNLSGKEILEAFTSPEERAELKRKVESEFKENFESADRAFAKFLDRKGGALERQNAIEDLRKLAAERLGKFGNNDFEGPLRRLESFDRLKSLQEADSPEKAAEELRKLVELASDGKHHELSSAIYDFTGGNPERIQESIDQLSGRDVGSTLSSYEIKQKQNEAFENLKAKFANVESNFDALRSTRIVRDLHAGASPKEFETARKALQDELKAGKDRKNESADEWLKWVSAGESASRLPAAFDAKDPAKESREAVKDLIRHAESNPHARAALAGILMSGAEKADRLNWLDAGHGRLDEKPVLIPDLSRLSPELQSAVKLEAAEALLKLAAASPESLSQAEASALAIAAGKAHKDGTIELSSALKSGLESLVQSNARPQVMKGIFEAIRAQAEGNESLAQIYLKGTTDRSFPTQFRSLENWAGQGDEASIKILAGLSAGIADKGNGKNSNNEGMSFSSRSQYVLEELAKLPQQGEKVLAALLENKRIHEDGAVLLATMGRVASSMDQSKVSKEVHDCLKAGLSSPDKHTVKSAVAGLIAMAPHWDESYRAAVLKSLSPEMVIAIRDNVERIPEQHRAAILEAQHQRLLSADAALLERKAAIQTMSALAKYATREQVASLANLGGAAGEARLAKLATGKDEIRAIQAEAGKALLRMMAVSASGIDGQAGPREAAFDAFKKHNWPGLEKPELKRALEAYAQGKPFDLSVNKELGRILYEAGLPRPPAGILKDWGVPGTDAQLFDKAKLLTEKLADPSKKISGEEALVRLASNIELVNSLDPRVFPGLRKELTGSDSQVIPAQVVGQILNGSIKESANAAVLSDINAKLNELSRNSNAEVGRLNDEFKQALAAKKSSIKELTAMTREGIGLGDRVAYVFGSNYINEFTEKQARLVDKFKEKDLALSAKSEELGRANFRNQALNLAAEIKDYTTWKNNGKQMEADRLAARLLTQHNAYLSVVAPSIFHDLTVSGDGQSGRSGLARLKDAGLGQFDNLPEFAQGPAGFDKALGVLSAIKAKADYEQGAIWSSRFVDSAGMRAYALGRVDSEATLAKMSQVSRVLDKNLGDVQELFEAASKGSKYGPFIAETQDKARHIQRLFKEPSAELSRLKDGNLSEAERRKTFDELTINMSDAASKEALWDKVKTAAFDEAIENSLRTASGYVSSADVAALKDRVGDLKKTYENMLKGPDEDLRKLRDTNLAENERRKAFERLTANMPSEEGRAELWRSVKDGSIDSRTLDSLKRLNQPDEASLSELKRRIDTMEQLAGMLDPSSEHRKNLEKLCQQITSPNFKESTFLNWVKENGPVIGATIVAVAATAAAAATFGAATPLAVAGWALVGATATLALTEVTKEGLYQLNSSVGYTGWGVYGDRSKLGAWASKIGERDLTDNMKGLFWEVAAPYSKQIAFDTAIALATLGVGKLFSSALGKMTAEGAKTFLAAEGQTMAKIAQQGEQLAEIAAKSPQANKFLSVFLPHMGKEMVWQSGYTGAAMLVEHGAHQVLPEKLMEKAGPTLSVGIGLGLALLDPHLRSINFKPSKGTHIQAELAPGSNFNENMNRLAEHLRKQGHEVEVKYNNGEAELKIRTYDQKPGEPGFTIGKGLEARFPDPAPVHESNQVKNPGKEGRPLSNEAETVHAPKSESLAKAGANYERAEVPAAAKPEQFKFAASTRELLPGNFEGMSKSGKSIVEYPNGIKGEVSIEPKKFKALEAAYDQFMGELKNASHLSGAERDAAMAKLVNRFDREFLPVLQDAGIKTGISNQPYMKPLFDIELNPQYRMRPGDKAIDLNTEQGLRKFLQEHPNGKQIFQDLLSVKNSGFNYSFDPKPPAGKPDPGVNPNGRTPLSEQQRSALAVAIINDNRGAFKGVRLNENATVNVKPEMTVLEHSSDISSSRAAFNRAEEWTHLMGLLNDNKPISRGGKSVSELYDQNALSEMRIAKEMAVMENDFIQSMKERGINVDPELMKAPGYYRQEIEALLQQRGLAPNWEKVSPKPAESQGGPVERAAATAGTGLSPADRLTRMKQQLMEPATRSAREPQLIAEERSQLLKKQEATQKSLSELEELGKAKPLSPKEQSELSRLRIDERTNLQRLDNLKREMILFLDKKLEPYRAQLKEQMPALEQEIRANEALYKEKVTEYLKQQNHLQEERQQAKENGNKAREQEIGEEMLKIKQARADFEQTYRKSMQDLHELRDAAGRIMNSSASPNSSQSSVSTSSGSSKSLDRQAFNRVINEARPHDIALQAERGYMPTTRDSSSQYFMKTSRDVAVEVTGKVSRERAMEVLDRLSDSIVKPAKIEIMNDAASPYNGLAIAESGAGGRYSTVKLNFANGESRVLTYDHELGHVFDHTKIKGNSEINSKVKTAYERDLKEAALEAKLNEILKKHDYVSPETKDALRYGMDGANRAELHKAYVNSRDEVVAESFKLFMQEKQPLKPGEKALSYKERVEKFVEDPQRRAAMLRFEETYKSLSKEVFEPNFQAEMARRAGGKGAPATDGIKPAVKSVEKQELSPQRAEVGKEHDSVKAGEKKLDPASLRPEDPLYASWMENALKSLKLDADELAIMKSALEKGEVKFSVLDRKGLEALELNQRIFSFEGGKEVNSAPYQVGGQVKTPLRNADLYDPASWPAATIVVKVDGVNGQPANYYVVNGCRRVHVFGSETLNPNNKQIPILLFDSPAALEKVLGHDPSSGIRRATPFNFEFKK